MTDEINLTRRERQHLEVLEERLAHLHQDRPERHGDPAYPAGEAGAIAWVLAVVRGIEDPIEIRMQRLERVVRQLGTRVGRIEHDLDEEE